MPSKDNSISKKCAEKELNETIFPLIDHLVKKYNKNIKISLTKGEEKVVSDILNEFKFTNEQKKLIKNIIVRVYDNKINDKYLYNERGSFSGGSKSLVRYNKSSKKYTNYEYINLSAIVLFICAMVVLIAFIVEFRVFFEQIDPNTEHDTFLIFVKLLYIKLLNKRKFITDMITAAATNYGESVVDGIQKNCMKVNSYSNTVLTTIMSVISPDEINECMFTESKNIFNQQVNQLQTTYNRLMIPFIWSLRIIVVDGIYLSVLLGCKVYNLYSNNRTIRNSDSQPRRGTRKRTIKDK